METTKVRNFFGTNSLIDDFKSKLTKVECSDNGWSTKHLDEQTGQYWLEYIVDDRSYYRNLMNISQPLATNELINIALTSIFPD